MCPEPPKIELNSFDCQPAKYWTFIRQFWLYLVFKVDDDGQLLLFMLHYCKGKAREALEECIMLPPSSGCYRACNTLKRLFDRTHEVSWALLKDSTECSIIEHSDGENLSSLAIEIKHCSIASKKIDYSAELNSLGTIESIVWKLPTDYR